LDAKTIKEHCIWKIVSFNPYDNGSCQLSQRTLCQICQLSVTPIVSHWRLHFMLHIIHKRRNTA